VIFVQGFRYLSRLPCKCAYIYIMVLNFNIFTSIERVLGRLCFYEPSRFEKGLLSRGDITYMCALAQHLGNKPWKLMLYTIMFTWTSGFPVIWWFPSFGPFALICMINQKLYTAKVENYTRKHVNTTIYTPIAPVVVERVLPDTEDVEEPVRPEPVIRLPDVEAQPVTISDEERQGRIDANRRFREEQQQRLLQNNRWLIEQNTALMTTPPRSPNLTGNCDNIDQGEVRAHFERHVPIPNLPTQPSVQTPSVAGTETTVPTDEEDEFTLVSHKRKKTKWVKPPKPHNTINGANAARRIKNRKKVKLGNRKKRGYFYDNLGERVRHNLNCEIPVDATERILSLPAQSSVMMKTATRLDLNCKTAVVKDERKRSSSPARYRL